MRLDQPTITVLEQARSACADLCNPGQMRRRADMAGRAQLMLAVIRSRERFQQIVDRNLQLQCALDRFQQRRGTINP